jgi:hypothetical protein
MKKTKGLLQVLGSEEREKIRVLIKMIQLVVQYLIDINLMVVLPNKLTERYHSIAEFTNSVQCRI